MDGRRGEGRRGRAGLGALARVARPVTLPVKLVAAAMLVLSVAAVVTAAAGVTLLHHYLDAQADRELRSYAADLVDGSFVQRPVFGGPGPSDMSTAGISVEVVDPGGHRLVRSGTGQGGQPGGVPVSSAWISSHIGQLVTIPGPRGRGTWRVIVRAIHYTARHIPFVYGAEDVSIVVSARNLPGLPGLVVVGMNLAGISQATHRFAVDDLLVAAIVLLLLAVVGARLCRAALRPLRLIAETAAAAPGEMPPPAPRRPGGGLDGVGLAVGAALVRAGEASGPPAPAVAAARASEERMRQALTDAGDGIRKSLSVIGGFTDYYRSGRAGQPGSGLRPADLDRMMARVADEAARMAAAADDLLREAGHDPPE
jgi:hypothetical protein